MMMRRRSLVGSGREEHWNQRGSTIMLVTLILALMGTIALFLLYRVDAERLIAINMEKRLRFQQTAEAVLQRYLGLLMADDKPEIDTQRDDWYAGGRVEFEENGFLITVMIEDEASKPNINLQDADALRYLLPTDPPIIPIDSLLDWLDPDSDAREKGAELDYYQGLTPPFKPRNGFMASVEEMKAIKDSEKFYSHIAPEVTVYGKINPNTLDPWAFQAFLLAIGLDKHNFENSNWVVDRRGEFEKYRLSNRRFNKIDDFKGDIQMVQSDRDMIEPFVQFKGSYNPNFVNKQGLRMIMRQISLQMGKIGRPVEINPEHAETIINSRNTQPLESLDIFSRNYPLPPVGDTYASINVGDYFTLVSTIIRYRIWVVKGSGKYYLESIQERVPVKGIKNWELHPLTWKVLNNNEVPEIPELPTPTPAPG